MIGYTYCPPYRKNLTILEVGKKMEECQQSLNLNIFNSNRKKKRNKLIQVPKCQ